MTSRFAIAKEKLLADLESVIPDLLGSRATAKRNQRKRARWNVVNPWRAQADAGQTIIWLTGARRGGWKDFVSGDKGDVVDLVAFVKEGYVTRESRMRAVEWAEDRYGIRALDPATKQKIAEEAAARARKLAQEQAAEQKTMRDRARKMFFACEVRLEGTPVETYLAGRGVLLAEVPHITPAFRYRADCEYWPLGQYRDDQVRVPGPSFPAMVSAMVSADGTLNALHLTYLAPDGRGKAPVKQIARRRGLDPKEFSEKLFKGDVAGFVIRCTNGPSGLSAEKAAAAGVAGPCGLTEGIEDGLTAGTQEPRLRMWAAGSLSGLLYVPDHACVSSWLMFKDNDWGKPQATALFNQAYRRLRGFGKPVEVLAMPADWGKDVNDAINQEA